MVETSCLAARHGLEPWSHVGKLRSCMRDSQKVKEKKNPQKQITFCSRDNLLVLSYRCDRSIPCPEDKEEESQVEL